MKIKHTILVGEPMGLFIADELGKLEDVNHFSFTTTIPLEPVLLTASKNSASPRI